MKNVKNLKIANIKLYYVRIYRKNDVNTPPKSKNNTRTEDIISFLQFVYEKNFLYGKRTVK